MKKTTLPLFPVLTALLVLAANGPSVFCAEASVRFAGDPLRYTSVSGDHEKFREQHWIREGYEGGIDEFSLESHDLPADIRTSIYVHSLANDNDHEVRADVSKENFGYVRIRYKEFSKFFDDNGGVYYPFRTLVSSDLNRDLELETGYFSIEAGLTPENLPALSFFYERRFKDGQKSRLTWASVTEGSTVRNIAPSWQEIDEIVDTFAIRLDGDVKGFGLKAEQKWELEEAEYIREEQFLSTSPSSPSSKKIRRQEQTPEARSVATTVELEKWASEDKVFMGTAYHFVHLKSQELENIFEMNENRVITNFSNPKQVRSATADNEFDAHTWVANSMLTPFPYLSFTGKLKSELIERHGNSLYPQDTTPVSANGSAPDGIINTTEASSINNNLRRFGEAFGVRFTGVPLTSLYSEFELEQIRNWLAEDRTSLANQSAPNANEIFSRETITNSLGGTWTLGTRITPCRFVDMTGQYRYRRSNNDYDDQRETVPTGSTARSAFFDELSMTLQEVATRITFKVNSWLRTSFRYRLQTHNYGSRVENLDEVQTDMTAHIFSYDVSVQPVAKMLLMSSITHQQAWVETPAATASTANTPRFDFDYTSWFITGEYQVHEKVSFWSSWMITLASNFNNFSSVGLPLGADFTQMDLGTGLRVAVTEAFSVEPRYDYFNYLPSTLTDVSDYHAHMIGFKGTVQWG
ncbi:MAG: hypothetical protein A2Z83_06805 [Omnitrophica bacterium GWA2_52_8]|nr:MAG: hypothetical protein A2Z83_06805 [Omnitrophica bacterium GWA2_52_8]